MFDFFELSVFKSDFTSADFFIACLLQFVGKPVYAFSQSFIFDCLSCADAVEECCTMATIFDFLACLIFFVLAGGAKFDAHILCEKRNR